MRNSSLKVAESRLFPIGHPGLIPQPGSLVSPFDIATFSNSLLPLISAGIREKVKDITKSFNDGFDYVEDSIREGWRESPLNPYNYEKVLSNPPNLFKHLPIGNHITVNNPHTGSYKHYKYPHQQHKDKAPKSVSFESYKQDEMMHEFGINGYKHFEESILREIEKQEELKVEATIHTLFPKDDHVEIVRGKPYEEKIGWKPVAAPTKVYDDGSDISSQIVSPLHTSFISASDAISNVLNDQPSPLGFHDFDQFHSDFLQPGYASHEERGESKVKPVKAKISPLKRITPVPPIYSTESSTISFKQNNSTQSRSRVFPTASSNNKKRQIISTTKTIVEEKINEKVSDTSTSASNEVPVVVSATLKKHLQKTHIQSVTTSKPKNHSIFIRNSSYLHGSENNSESNSRLRTYPSSRPTTKITTTTTTKKPVKNVPRETSKFVDKARVTGFRGAVKYKQSTTKQADFAQRK